MNCHEAQTWILKSEAPALVPLPLADHLRDCGRCRKVHEQLLVVERQLQTAPLPGIPVHAKNALMEAIAAPVKASRPPVVKQKRRRRVRVEHLVGYAMATAASITVGIVMGYGLAGRGGPGAPVANPVSATKGGSGRVAEVLPVRGHEDKPTPTQLPKKELPTPENVSPAVPLVATSPSPSVITAGGPSISATGNSDDVTSPIPPPRKVEEGSSPLVEAKFLTDDELLAKFIANHTEVASVTDAKDRLDRLATLSDLIWVQAIKEAESGAATNGDWLKESYSAIVEIDLPALARELPDESQEAAAALAVALEERASEAERLVADAPPNSALLLRQLQRVSSSGAQKVLKKTRDPLTLRPRFNGGSTLLPMVVEETIAVARESQPLERADHSAELAEGLAQDIVLTALRGDGNRAAALGGHYGRVLEQGIAVNLQRINPKEATYQQTRRYQQVVGRTQQSIVFLQKSLEAAPPQAQAGLRLAMEQGGLATLVPPPGPERRVWVLDVRILRELHRHLK